MIAMLTGEIVEATLENFVVNVQGVGYEILASQQTLSDAQTLLGQNLRVYIHTHVREDALTLFGFLTRDDKEFFLELLKVNGIGPKMALAIMSGASSHQIREWIETSDVKSLSKIPKVGKKTAEQMILTLQGKLVRLESKAAAGKLKISESHKQIASALVNLGFKSQKVDEFVAKLGLEIKIEEGVREGLRALSGQGM